MLSFSKPSPVEDAAIEILKNYPEGLISTELVAKIKEHLPDKLNSSNPDKSFYSIIYRRENKRQILGIPRVFFITKKEKSLSRTKRDTQLLYKLNLSGGNK